MFTSCPPPGLFLTLPCVTVPSSPTSPRPVGSSGQIGCVAVGPLPLIPPNLLRHYLPLFSSLQPPWQPAFSARRRHLEATAATEIWGPQSAVGLSKICASPHHSGRCCGMSCVPYSEQQAIVTTGSATCPSKRTTLGQPHLCRFPGTIFKGPSNHRSLTTGGLVPAWCFIDFIERTTDPTPVSPRVRIVAAHICCGAPRGFRHW